MFKKLFRRISLRVWVLQQKFKKEEKENYWQDEWPYESSRTYIWDKEFLKGIINRNKAVDAK